MMGSDGILWPWSYGEENSRSWNSSSSSSGTIVSISTAYTCSSRGSRLSSVSLVPGIYLEWEVEKMKYIKGLVHEFSGAPSANCSINVGGGDMGVLERWLTELGVGWVLHLANGASVDDVWSWIRAHAVIVETIGFTTAMPIISEQEEHSVPDQLQFARFFQETMLKMLAFVDFIVCSNGFEASQLDMLAFLLGVHGALSKALPQIRLSSCSPPSAEVARIQGSMVSLLAAKEAKAGEAVWSKMEEIRTRILESIQEDVVQQGSSDINRATRTVISYIRFLQDNYSTAAPVVSEAATVGKYVPHHIENVPPLDSMIVEMASCVEEKLANISESFLDQGLRFLFLLNNLYFIWQHIQPNCSVMGCNVNAIDHQFLSFTKTHMTTVTRKLEGYMESYLQASWAPMLWSLVYTTPSSYCFCANYSALMNKFESEFQKTYTTQKLWKVPDPGLRKILRKAVTDKIMSGYTEYIYVNNITTPTVDPQELEEMLQELFEG